VEIDGNPILFAEVKLVSPNEFAEVMLMLMQMLKITFIIVDDFGPCHVALV